MAKHYLSTTSSRIEVIDYSYSDADWTKIVLVITVSVDGAVTYTATSTNSTGGYKYVGMWITVNGVTVGNNYYNATSECIGSSYFPINHNSSYSASAGTVTGDSVSYEVKLDCGSDGGQHGWTGSASTNYKGITKTGSVTRNYYNDPGVPTVSIIDSLKNSFTVSATKGSDGSSNYKTNTANGVTSVQYSYDNKTWTNYTGAVNITADKTVYARAKTDGSISDSEYNTVGPVNVNYYTRPTQATNLQITSTNVKYTDKADYTFSWINPKPGSHNPVKYVLFKLYKNGVQITDDSNYQMTDGRTSITLTPQQMNGLATGDTLYFSIDGLATNSNFSQEQATSETITIASAIMVKVKTESGWKESIAFIKTAEGWKSGTLFIKTTDGWKIVGDASN